AAAMAANPLVDAEEELDAAATADDAPGRPLPPGAGTGRNCRPVAAAWGELGGLRPAAGATPARPSHGGNDRGRADQRWGDDGRSRLARPAAAAGIRRGRGEWGEAQAVARQSGPAAGGRGPGGLPAGPAPLRRAAGSPRAP